jgi:hypothetical protein
VLAWAKAHPDDPRLAEALHRVVRATRSGCTTEGSGDVSREAFTRLHKLFPRSEWAKRTPYCQGLMGRSGINFQRPTSNSQ